MDVGHSGCQSTKNKMKNWDTITDWGFMLLILIILMAASYFLTGCQGHKCESCPEWPKHGPCPVMPDNCCHKK